MLGPRLPGLFTPLQALSSQASTAAVEHNANFFYPYLSVSLGPSGCTALDGDLVGDTQRSDHARLGV